MFTWTQIIRIKSLIRIKILLLLFLLLLVQKILIGYGPFGKNFHSEQERWFMPIVIPTSVHVHICFNRVSLVGVKLSLLLADAVRFQNGAAHAVFLSAFL